MVVFSVVSVQLSAQLSAMIPGCFASKAGFLERNFQSFSPGMVVSCFAHSETNVLELRGDWETLKQAHEILETWMEEQNCALKTSVSVSDSDIVAKPKAVSNCNTVSDTEKSPIKQRIASSPVQTMSEESCDIVVSIKDVVPDFNNDIKDEKMSPDKSKKEGRSDMGSSAEMLESNFADVKCPDENKLCKKRKVTPHHTKPKLCNKLSMNLRSRTIGTAVTLDLQLKEEEEHRAQQKDAALVNVNSGHSGDTTDIGEDTSDPDWQGDECQIKDKNGVDLLDDGKDGKNKDKLNVTSKKVIKKGHCNNEMDIQQTVISKDDDGFDPSPVRCHLCTYKTNSSRNLRHHMKRKHMERTFKCTECDKAFGLGKDLREHMRSHSKQVACEVCGKKFTRNYFLQKHFANKHVTKKDKSEKVEKSKEKLEKPLVYGCRQCDYIGKTARNLRIHETRTHGEKTLPCPMCNKTFAMTKDLNQHVRTHTQRFCCDICGKALKSKFALQLHRNSIHLGIKNTYVKHYLCTICGKLCNNKTVYREHQNKEHLGIKPFVCEVCGVAFFAKASLRVHRRIHSDVRSHMCDICGKAFKGRQSLRLHQNIHQQWRPHKCEQCNKKFTQKGALVRHIRIHTGERPFKCRLCSASFNDYSILRRHLMGIHKLPDGRIREQPIHTVIEEKRFTVPVDAVDSSTTLASVANTAVYAAGDLVGTENMPMMSSAQELPDMAVSVSVAATLQCADHLTDMAGLESQQLPHSVQISLPPMHGSDVATAVFHDHNAIMHSARGGDLLMDKCEHQQAVSMQEAGHEMSVVTVSVQDHRDVLMAATMQKPDHNQQLTAPVHNQQLTAPVHNQQLTSTVQAAAHTLVHNVGRIRITNIPHVSSHFNPQPHGMGLSLSPLPGMMPGLHAPADLHVPSLQTTYPGVNPQTCTNNMLNRDVSTAENGHIHLL